MAIVATFDQEPTFAIPGRIPAKKTTWRIYNWPCKVERMQPNYKNSVCKNCLEFGHPTDVCMASNKVPKCGYCGGTHNHFNHECTAPGCNEKTPCHHLCSTATCVGPQVTTTHSIETALLTRHETHQEPVRAPHHRTHNPWKNE